MRIIKTRTDVFIIRVLYLIIINFYCFFFLPLPFIININYPYRPFFFDN